MSFVLKKPATFTIEAVPVTEPGQETPGTMRVEYIYRTRADFDAWLESIKDKPVIDVVPEFVKNWGDCRDVDGNEIPYSPDALRQIAELSPAFPLDLYVGYRKGLFDSRVKN